MDMFSWRYVHDVQLVKVLSIDIIVCLFRKLSTTSMYFHVCKKNYPASSGEHILMILGSFESYINKAIK